MPIVSGEVVEKDDKKQSANNLSDVKFRFYGKEIGYKEVYTGFIIFIILLVVVAVVKNLFR